MIGRCQPAIGQFSGFPAGSLPSPRLLPSVVSKSMIASGFSAPGAPQKIFFPVFSRAAGNGRGDATPPACAPLLLRAADAARERCRVSRTERSDLTSPGSLPDFPTDIIVGRAILSRAAGPGFNLDQGDGFLLRYARLSTNSRRPLI